MSKIKRGIAICHYNRLDTLGEIIAAVKKTAPVETRIVVCDDGTYPKCSELNNIPPTVEYITHEQSVLLIKGPNLGVAANKNRALWSLQDCHFISILEDDLKPIKGNWFETYEKAATLSGIHHFCRVQDREVSETVGSFSAYMKQNKLTPIYGPNPRGDLTFITNHLLQVVGGFNPRFRGCGSAHGEWSTRAKRAGLINHPNCWIDIKEARDNFVQLGDTSGGRWTLDQEIIRKQLQRNAQVLKELQREDYIHCPLELL